MNGFDSVGELHFSYWCEELKKKGYIEHYEFQPEAYDLSSKVTSTYKKPMKRVEDKVLEQTILQPHIYTPDVLIIWNSKAQGVFYNTLEDCSKVEPHQMIANWQGYENRMVWASTIELKPTFDHQNMTRLASLNIKWVYEKHKHVIEMVKLPDFFKKTFTPNRYLLTDKTYVTRKLKYKPTTLNEFITSLQK